MKNATNFRVQFKRNKEIYEEQLIEHVENTHRVTLSTIEKLMDNACEKRKRYVEIGLDDETASIFNIMVKFSEIVSYLKAKGFNVEYKSIIEDVGGFWSMKLIEKKYYVISW